MNSREQILKAILRIFGSSSLLAVIFVAAPFSWMQEIHASLGMGSLPDAPIVGYLARSTSAFYALVGGLFWVVSFDLQRFRPVVIYLGAAITVLGAAFVVIDWAEGLPLYWKAWEGPFVIALGLSLFFLGRALEPTDPAS